MRTIRGLAVVCSLVGVACAGRSSSAPAEAPAETAGSEAQADSAAQSGRAEATIEPRSGNEALSGQLTIEPQGDTVRLTLKVTGAPPGEHGAHLHENGDCSAPDATSAGGHWNPTGTPHGAPGQPSHLGDLGNIKIGEDGSGELTMDNPAWHIGDGAAEDVVGKAIIIHANPDDLSSQPSGNAGGRIGCGVIALQR